jgi:hypothetical protein
MSNDPCFQSHRATWRARGLAIARHRAHTDARDARSTADARSKRSKEFSPSFRDRTRPISTRTMFAKAMIQTRGTTAAVTLRSTRRSTSAGGRTRAARVVRAMADAGAERRASETARVLERTKEISNSAELDAALALAGDDLVMLAIESDEECYAGESAWSGSDAKMASCKQLSASLARIAREAEDVTFLQLDVVGHEDARALAKELGVHQFPTYQYYKHGELMWEHVGAGAGSHEKIAEGVLYYGNTGAGGMKTTEYIQEVQSAADLEGFLASCAPEQDVAGLVAPISVPCEKQLAVVDVSIEKNAPAGCMHIFPAIVSLAKNTAGATRWARLIGDASEDAVALMKSMKVTEVPTFVFYADGKEVDRYSGSDRMALMNKVLQFQRANGVKLPERATRKRMSTAEAKEIARAAREREKAAGRRSGW